MPSMCVCLGLFVTAITTAIDVVVVVVVVIVAVTGACDDGGEDVDGGKRTTNLATAASLPKPVYSLES